MSDPEGISQLMKLIPDMVKEERGAHKKIESLMFEIINLNKRNEQMRIEYAKMQEDLKQALTDKDRWRGHCMVLHNQIRHLGYESVHQGCNPNSRSFLRPLPNDDDDEPETSRPAKRKSKEVGVGGYIRCDSDEEPEEEEEAVNGHS